MAPDDDMTGDETRPDTPGGARPEREDRATVDSALHLAGGIGTDERDRVVSLMSALDTRLRSFAIDEVELRLSVKDRSSLTQEMTLEALIAGHRRIVTTSGHARFEEALGEVRDDLIRRLGDLTGQTEVRNNRRLRRTIRR